MRRLLLLLTVALAVIAGAARADLPLPASTWYAVVWHQDTDTLHWISAGGEQASIPRPKLPNESPQGASGLHVSPNGRYLVIISSLSGEALQTGLGFYDLQTGAFAQTHQSQPGEFIDVSAHHPINLSSTRYAVALNTPSSGAWRVINFDLTTGDALGQLSSSDPMAPDIAPVGWRPRVILYGFDEALNYARVHVQFEGDANLPAVAEYPSFFWIPEPVPAVQNNLVQPGGAPYNPVSGYDIVPANGQVAYSWYDPQFGSQPSQAAATSIGTAFITNDQSFNVVFADTAIQPHSARWLNGVQWIGFRVNQQPFQPHWSIIPVAGEGGTVATNRIPLGPNFTDLRGTPDGYLAVDASAGRIDHETQYFVEGFAAAVGNPVFATQPGSNFAIIYVTPLGASFTLANIKDGIAGAGVDAVAGVDVQPPTVACDGAPPMRLAIGIHGRVAFTDGASLRVRNAPAGDIITQIPEGTEFDVIGGPQCSGGYLWWQINTAGGVGGWSAEGDADGYFLEPFSPPPGGTGDIQARPTSTPLVLQVGTIQPPLQMVTPLGIAPTATPGRVGGPGQVVANGSCSLAPPQQVQVGLQYRVTIDPGSTLAMRANATDPFPTYQLPNGQIVVTIGGPACFGDYRIWQVRTTLSGQDITGWVYEGIQNQYYLTAV